MRGVAEPERRGVVLRVAAGRRPCRSARRRRSRARCRRRGRMRSPVSPSRRKCTDGVVGEASTPSSRVSAECAISGVQVGRRPPAARWPARSSPRRRCAGSAAGRRPRAWCSTPYSTPCRRGAPRSNSPAGSPRRAARHSLVILLPTEMHQVALAAGQPDADPEPLVVLLVDDHVVVGRGADQVPPAPGTAARPRRR